MTRKWVCFIALSFAVWAQVASAAAGSPPSTPASGDNAVTAIRLEETESATFLHISVAQEPTFSVFKLRNPSRLLVEVSDCVPSAVPALAIRNGVIDQATVSSQSSQGAQRCRVVVSLDREVRYDVDAKTNEIILSIDADGRQQTAQAESREVLLARAQVELQNASVALGELSSQRTSALEQVSALEGKVKTLAGSADHNKDEARRLQVSLQEQRDRADAMGQKVSAQAELVASLNGQIDALLAENSAARERLTKLSQDRDMAARRAEVAETRASELNQEVESLRSALSRSQQDDAQTAKLGALLESAGARKAELELEIARLNTAVSSGQANAEMRLAVAERAFDDSNRAIQGLDKQLATLQAEAKRERALLSEQIQAREKELTQAVAKSDQLKAESESRVVALAEALRDRDAKLEAKERELAGLRDKEARLRADLDKARSHKDDNASVMQDEVNALMREQARLQTEMEQEVASLRLTLAEREAALERVQGREAELASKYAELRAERDKEQVAVEALLAARESKLNKARQSETALREELAALHQQLELGADPGVGAVLAEKEADLSRAVSQQAEMQEEVERLGARLVTNREEAERVRQQAEKAQVAAQEREAKLNGEVERLRTTSSRTADQLAQAQARESALRAEVAELSAKLDDAAKAKEEIAALRTRVEDGERAQVEIAKLRQEKQNADAARVELKRLRVQVGDAEAAQAEVARLKAQIKKSEQASADLEVLRKQVDEAKLAKAEVARLRKLVDAAEAAKAHAGAAPLDHQAVAVSSSTKAAPLDEAVAATSPGAKVRDIRFEKDGVMSRVLIDLGGTGNHPKYHTSPWADGRSTLVLEGVSVPDALIRKLDTRAFKSPVQFISALRDGGDVHLVADLDGAASEVVRTAGGTLVWEFAESVDESMAADGGANAAFAASDFEDRRKRVRISAAAPDMTPSAGQDDIALQFGKRERLKRGRFSQRRITLDVRDAEINDLLRLIADEVGVSIVTSPDVEGRVTLSLKSVPLDQALDIILRAQDLGMRQEGNIIWIAQAEVFRAEQQRELEAVIVREKLEPLEVRLLPVNYATASELQENVNALLSERGSVAIDARTNTLIIKDVAANLDAAEVLVDSLDTQTPQILIEARIVETQSNYTQELGVQWGGDFSFSPANGNPTGLIFPSSIGVAGGSTADSNSGTVATPNFAVNLPAAVGTGSGGALGMTFGSVGGAVNLSLRLSALEEKGFVKIVSAPRVMTLDNVQASIEQGVSIPVSVVSAAGVQTVFFDAKLNLSVTPHVTKDGNIFLAIDVTKNEPDFANTGAQGDPSIIRKEAHTQLLVPDGDTTVIGGIYTRNTAQGVNTVPFFGSLPIIGYFFKKTTETDNRTELLIFITPRIINRESSIGVSGPGSFIAPSQEDGEE